MEMFKNRDMLLIVEELKEIATDLGYDVEELKRKIVEQPENAYGAYLITNMDELIKTWDEHSNVKFDDIVNEDDQDATDFGIFCIYEFFYSLIKSKEV